MRRGRVLVGIGLLAAALGVLVMGYRQRGERAAAGAQGKAPIAARRVTAPALLEPVRPDPARNDRAKELLLAYHQVRSRAVWDHSVPESLLQGLQEEDVLLRAEQIFRNGGPSRDFSDEEEELRLVLLDYVGDAARGRIPFESAECAKGLLLSIAMGEEWIRVDVSRLRASLLGDKIEAMEKLTEADEELALLQLREGRARKDFKYLLEGAENGLYRKGLSKRAIEEKVYL